MAKITDVREIVSTHRVARDDGKVFTLQVLRFNVSRSSFFETYSYTCEVFDGSAGGNRMLFPELKESNPEQLKMAALAAIEKL